MRNGADCFKQALSMQGSELTLLISQDATGPWEKMRCGASLVLRGVGVGVGWE